MNVINYYELNEIVPLQLCAINLDHARHIVKDRDTEVLNLENLSPV